MTLPRHYGLFLSRIKLALLGVAVLVVACGCAVKKPPSTAQTIKDSLPSTTTVPGEWTSKNVSGAAVSDDWLKSFQDPQLDALVAEAQKNNLYLQAAVTRIDYAANVVTEARAQMLPLIGVLGAGTYLGRYDEKNVRGKNKGRYNASNLLGSISWEVDLWARIRSQAAAAQQSLAATQADVLFARQSLAAAVARTWYLTACTAILQGYAQRNVELKQQSYGLAKIKLDVGSVDEQQVAMAAADLQTAQSQLSQISLSYQQLLRGLDVLLGRYPAGELQTLSALPPLPPPVPAGLPSQLLERRPDVIAAERNFDAAFHMVQSAKAAQLPTLSLTGAGGYMTNEVYQKLALRPWVWTVGANLAAPLYTGGFLQAQVKIANDNQKAALAMYGETALEAFAEVEVTLTNERYLRQQQQDYSGVLQNLTTTLDIEKTKFAIGQVDLDPVLQLEAAQLGAQMAATQIQYELLANRINLYLALGGGF